MPTAPRSAGGPIWRLSKDGRVVLRKQIVVNEPLVYDGVRFYQASYGKTAKIDKLVLEATPRDGSASKEITIGLDETAPLDADITVRLAEFIPDYVVSDGHVYARSNDLENPAAHLIVQSKKSGQAVNVWLPPIPGLEQNALSPYAFEGKDVQMAYFTGLEVSHEPGQWAVWAGVIVMGFGLVVVFYLVHMRFWVVPVRDAHGQLQLWIGGIANKNKDAFEQRFRDSCGKIRIRSKNSKSRQPLRRLQPHSPEDKPGNGGWLWHVQLSNSNRAATGTGSGRRRGTGSGFPAVHGIPQRGEERQPAQRIQPALRNAHLLFGRREHFIWVSESPALLLISALPRWPHGRD